MFWFKKKQKSWWEETIKKLQSATVSLEEKKAVVDGIASQLALLSEDEWDHACPALMSALEALSHDLLLKQTWESNMEDLDGWVSLDRKALYDACITAKDAVSHAFADVRLGDLMVDTP